MISVDIEMPYCLGDTEGLGKQHMYEEMFFEMVEEGCDVEEIRDAWIGREKRLFDRWGAEPFLTDKQAKAHAKWYDIHEANTTGRKVIV